MKEKKDIDRLFQERFRDFEAQPAPEVWAGIQDRLEKKKSRRVIPLWWKLGGIAAALALLLVLGDLYFSPSGNSFQDNNPLVTTENEPQQDPADPASDSIAVETLENALVNSDSTPKTTDENPQNKQDKTSQAITVNEKNKAFGEKNNDNLNTGRTKTKSGKPAANRLKPGKITEKSIKTEALANKQEPGNNTKNQSKNEENQSAIAENQYKKDENQLENPEKPAESRSKLARNNKKPAKTEEEGESLTDLAETTEDEEGNEVKEKQSSKRWALTPNIAPIYYNSFGGSGIDPQFNGNEKQGEINMSYGLLVSYAVSDKITLRSGVNRIDLSYNTNNVVVSGGLQGGAIQSINYNTTAQAVRVSSSPSNSSSESFDNFLEIPEPDYPRGSLDQSLAYYEIPMEIEYALVERKIGLQLIGGLSTLLLQDDQIRLNQENFTTSLGTSNSLNEVSFSTNIGVGFNYKFTDEIKFNLEPMFKYQLNAYKNSVSSFKPYYLGLYTGLSIKF